MDSTFSNGRLSTVAFPCAGISLPVRLGARVPGCQEGTDLMIVRLHLPIVGSDNSDNSDEAAHKCVPHSMGQTTAELEHQRSYQGPARSIRALQNWGNAHTDGRVTADGRVSVPPRSDCGGGRGTGFQSEPWTFEALVWRWHAACLGMRQRPVLPAQRDCTPVLRQWLRTLGL